MTRTLYFIFGQKVTNRIQVRHVYNIITKLWRESKKYNARNKTFPSLFKHNSYVCVCVVCMYASMYLCTYACMMRVLRICVLSLCVYACFDVCMYAC